MVHTVDVEERVDSATQESLRDDLKKDNLVKFFADVSAQNIGPNLAIKLLNERLTPNVFISLVRWLAVK